SFEGGVVGAPVWAAAKATELNASAEIAINKVLIIFMSPVNWQESLPCFNALPECQVDGVSVMCSRLH
ncbi:hypothetical protein, partial [Corallococcus sp. CA041A]|uniref:hypothetical protein n=1 Tax=Corallococcus sp. CA041A TaxID=2316727 RepID=UPI001315374F